MAKPVESKRVDPERPAHDHGKSRNVLEVGQVVSGKYKLLRLLGDGGMGSVYEAEHLGLGTRVAIKVLHGDLARRAGIAERFLQEARVSAQIRSPHVVQVTDVDRTPDNVAYLVMELLQGEPLSSAVKRAGKMQTQTACEYTLQILQALEAAHALGVIHRDLKPDNVFVTFQGGRPVIKLIDFGIAKLKTAQPGQTKNLTVAGMLMGTPEYMAPEQAYSADKVDVRADLYAVGVMLYEMLAGQVPAEAEDPRVLIVKIERGDVKPLVQVAPGIRPEIAGFVHRAMAPRPELRFANATEMRFALEAIMSGKRVGTAKLPQAQTNVPSAIASSSGGQGGQAAFADTAEGRPGDRSEPHGVGTGTVMGAPAPAALTGPPPPLAPSVMQGAHPAAGGTMGVPLMSPHPAMSMVPQHHAPPPHYGTPYGSVAQTPEPARPPPKRGGSGLIIALAAVALLLGAGAVVAYVVGTQPTTPNVPPPVFATATTPAPTTTAAATTPPTTPMPVTPVTPLTTSTVIHPTPPGPNPSPPVAKKDAGAQPQPEAGAPTPQPPIVHDAGSGQTTITTPFGTFQFPGPRPPFYPENQPWPPPTIGPLPGPPQ